MATWVVDDKTLPSNSLVASAAAQAGLSPSIVPKAGCSTATGSGLRWRGWTSDVRVRALIWLQFFPWRTADARMWVWKRASPTPPADATPGSPARSLLPGQAVRKRRAWRGLRRT